MPKTTVDVAAPAPTETADAGALSPECVVEAPDYRAGGPLATLRRKISSRLARHVALERRQFVNVGPMVSFTFDDVAESAHSIGAEMLEKFKARGTYYVTSGLIGRKTSNYQIINRDGVRDLHLRGHEIGLHSHEHRAVGCLSAPEFRRDIELNRQALEGVHDGIRPRNFAYPFGMAAFERKRQLYALVSSSRGIAPGVNASGIDPQFLKCVELADARLTPETLVFYLDAAVRLNGWLIFLSHDIAACPSPYGCSLAFFQRALDAVAARGIEIATVTDALLRSQAAGAGLARHGQAPGRAGSRARCMARRLWAGS